MRKNDFINARLGRWKRLERVLHRLERIRARKLPEHELDEFVHLYRIACSDLARARSNDLGDDVVGYLNTMIARAYKQFHPTKPPRLHAAKRFFTTDFPRAVRAEGRFVLAATLLFVVPIFLTSLAVVKDPARAYVLSPPAQLEALTEAYAEGHQGGRSEGADSFMTGYYINNNIGIAFRCFATGVFFGLGSIFFLLFNGISAGAVGTYICVAGYSESFLSFVIGHGSFELTAIVLSGAAGLRLGMLLVNPGRLRRLDALRQHGPQMVKVILGAAAMLLVAALIEGFWSPSGAPTLVKFIVGSVLWLLVLGYLSLAGRRGDGNERLPAKEPVR